LFHLLNSFRHPPDLIHMVSSAQVSVEFFLGRMGIVQLSIPIIVCLDLGHIASPFVIDFVANIILCL
jgi:hypothetical protein